MRDWRVPCSVAVVTAVFLAFPAEALLAGDVNGNDETNAVDVQLVINAALGLGEDGPNDLDLNGSVNAVDVQLVINAALGLNNRVSYLSLIDEYNTAVMADGEFFHAMGGDRGFINEAEYVLSRDGDSAYTIEATADGAGLGGMWYSLVRIDQDNRTINFDAIVAGGITARGEAAAYPASVTGVRVEVAGVTSPSGNEDFALVMELKDASGAVVASERFPDIASANYPRTFWWDLSSENVEQVEVLTVLLDDGKTGDSIVLDRVALVTKAPDQSVTPVADQAFLWTLGWLLTNYDPVTGMVQDRSNFHAGDFENVSATAKAAKLVAYAYIKGYMSEADAAAYVTDIAGALLNTVPRGPAGVNSLWPHFTRNGGAERHPDSEWASGDTAYAALDLIVALALIGDPEDQIAAVEAFLTAIDWDDIVSSGYVAHGYTAAGDLSDYTWSGFGMETAGVVWAVASATGSAPAMDAPPSDNGSGFNDNAQYPLVLSGTDRWDNDWDAYRATAADAQIDYYADPSHENTSLSTAGLFGLSAAEEADAPHVYINFCIGGRYAPAEDGNVGTVVPHYSAMVSDIRPDAAVRMWRVLHGEERYGDASFLGDTIALSPLNNVESMRVDPATGEAVIHYFKGSWNLALQAEGWALADAATRAALREAVTGNAFLNAGYEILMTAPAP